MGKLIRYTVIFAAALALVGIFAIDKIAVDVKAEDLPQDIYTEQGDLLVLAQNKLIEVFTPGTGETEYTVTEDFLNYVILHSIRENVNDQYDPLNDLCEEPECAYIVDTPYGRVEYAFVELNEDDQLVVTVNFNRGDFPQFETAIFATFDVEVSLIDLEIVLTLDSVMLNDINISVENLDRILGLFDKAAIEDVMVIGVLDLDNYTYTVPLVP